MIKLSGGVPLTHSMDDVLTLFKENYSLLIYLIHTDSLNIEQMISKLVLI